LKNKVKFHDKLQQGTKVIKMKKIMIKHSKLIFALLVVVAIMPPPIWT